MLQDNEMDTESDPPYRVHQIAVCGALAYCMVYFETSPEFDAFPSGSNCERQR